ncbi:MAG: hypothetical protein GEU78_14610 [Actinobacteria bacterium]|nr:hypothetical protein [Actinomycetota bacterium]
MPTLTITHDTFEAVALMHAETMGIPEVPLLVEPTPKGGIVGVDIAAVVRENAENILRALTANEGG